MKNYHLLAIFLVFLMSCAVTPHTRNREEAKQNTTYLDDFVLKAPRGVGATWITYSLGRYMYRDNKYFKMNPGSTVYRYTFSEELYARDFMPAYSASPETNKNIELLRAKRGIAYSLIELGKLEEAEQQLKECLTIDPNDEKSQGEIQYIKSLKSDNK